MNLLETMPKSVDYIHIVYKRHASMDASLYNVAANNVNLCLFICISLNVCMYR